MPGESGFTGQLGSLSGRGYSVEGVSFDAS